MPKPAEPGPKAGKLPLDKMPLDTLVAHLPDSSPLLPSVQPPSQTGITGGYTVTIGQEPYFFDQNSFALIGDLSPGTRWSTLESVVNFQGDLLLGGYNWSGNFWGDQKPLLIRWDPDSQTATNLLASIGEGYWVWGVEVIQNNAYFTLFDANDQVQLGQIDGTTGAISYITLPSDFASPAFDLNMTAVGDNLLFPHYNAGFYGVHDFSVYNVTTATWSAYSLSSGADVFGSGFSFAGDYFTTAWDGSTYNIYRLDLDTGTSAIVAANAAISEPNQGGLYPTSATISDDLFLIAFKVSSGSWDSDIIRVDGTTGSLSTVWVSSSGQQAAWVIGKDDDSVYYALYDESDGRYDILKIAEDASGNTTASIFDISAITIAPGVVVGDHLYVGYTDQGLGGDWDFSRLDETTATMQTVYEFGQTTTWIGVQPLGVVNGYFAVAADTNNDGKFEMWTSPTNGSGSWQMISGDVEVRPYDFTAVLEGSYLI